MIKVFLIEMSCGDDDKHGPPGEDNLSVNLTAEKAVSSGSLVQTRKISCLMCLKQCPSGKEFLDNIPIKLMTFCTLLDLSIPEKSSCSFGGYDTPLCLECRENVIKIQSLQSQIEELQKSLQERRLSERRKLMSSCFGVDSAKWRNQDNTLMQFIRLISRFYKEDSQFNGPKERRSRRKQNIRKEIQANILKRGEGESLLPRCPSSNADGESVAILSESEPLNDSDDEHFEVKIQTFVDHSFQPVPIKAEVVETESVSNVKSVYDGPKGKSRTKRKTQRCKKEQVNSESQEVITRGRNKQFGTIKLEKTGTQRIKCQQCDATFIHKSKFERHFATKHKGEFRCESCNQSFALKKDLKCHKKSHHFTKKHTIDEQGRKKFDCEHCGMIFKNHCDILIHRRRHTGERPFKCEVCNEGFISKGRYEVHIEVTHPELPPLRCKFCPRSFFRHHRLRDHNLSHTGERPYMCEICSVSFSQPMYLKYHQTKHKELNFKEFKCDECEKTFASPVNLKLHKETQHQRMYRFRCAECGHGTVQLSHMKLHMRTHTGERPHLCPHCNKSFARGSLLKIHIRSHTNERPYVCNVCTKGFVSSSKLRRHETIHQSKNSKPKDAVPRTDGSSACAISESIGTESISVISAESVSTFNLPKDQPILKVEGVQVQEKTDTGQQWIAVQETSESGESCATYRLIGGGDIPHSSTASQNCTEYIILNGDFIIT